MSYSLPEWRALGHERQLLGRRIFVIDSGPAAGAPVLLLHGFPSASWDWSDVWDPLRARHRLVAFDFLGYGLSEKPPGHRYRIAEQADLAEAVAAEFGLERFHVIAHDIGDTVAQELLARQPSWRSLTLLNGGLFPETHRPRRAQKLLAGPLGPLLARFMGRRAFDRSFSAIFGAQTQPSPAQLEALWELLARENGLAALPSHLGYLLERRDNRERWVGALRETRVPLNLVNGSADPVSGAHMVARFRELFGPSHARIVELAGIGHYPQLEAPERVAAEALASMAASP